ncbi:uncharacterized protein LOC131659425 [Vicia villosa]|uniref:uncharacterized protein LOC131659425 n=1 Tax=Vicia villosa TaxID=3911 RepID=UPI00273C9184|nr:uncharacterized protein LOC131659425 [Vicia villosa]
MSNWLHLKTSIDIVRWLTLQACALRGHDETSNSRNQGNFLELLKLLASYNDEITKVVLENAPQNCKYTSHQILKELLQIHSSTVKKHIREEIGDSKFCIVVDEDRDESKKEQMALVLIFVDKFGLIQERFFDVAHVKDTTSLTLKEAICDILSRHNLDVFNIRGQGYDGASNMRGEWNVNVVCSSTKRHDELQASQLEGIAHLLEIGEIVTDTRWGSHYNSIYSLINMYEATCSVFKKIAKERGNYATRGDADSSYNYLKQFDFIFILHLMKEIMGTTNMLCQALQKQNQDVVNAMDLVRSTKSFIQDLRENGWDILFSTVTSFCEKHGIETPGLNNIHSATRFGRSRLEENQVTIQHYFKVEIFVILYSQFTTINKQLQELNSRFSEEAIDLLNLSCVLSPKDDYKAFNIDIICSLVEKYYPMDFSDQEKNNLQFQLRHFLFVARQASNLNNLSTIQELCSCLVETGQAGIYFLIDRLLRLIMTLPVSTATTERSFSAIKIIKTKL